MGVAAGQRDRRIQEPFDIARAKGFDEPAHRFLLTTFMRNDIFYGHSELPISPSAGLASASISAASCFFGCGNRAAIRDGAGRPCVYARAPAHFSARRANAPVAKWRVSGVTQNENNETANSAVDPSLATIISTVNRRPSS